MDKNNKISEEKLKKYLTITEKAFEKASESINKKKQNDAREILDMTKRYISDAKFFREKSDFVNAFAALNYAHGWLDAGSRLGIFTVKDNKLFVIK